MPVPEPLDGQSIIEWARAVARHLDDYRIEVAGGCGLAVRRTENGAILWAERSPQLIGVTTTPITGRAGDTPGTCKVRPCRFDGRKYVPTNAAVITVFNKSKESRTDSGYYVTFDYRLGGFPHLDWAECTPG